MEHLFSARARDIRLVPMTLEDALAYRVVRNANSSAFLTTAEVTENMQRAWFASYEEKPADYMFSIYADSFVGGCSLYNKDEERNSWEFGRIAIDSSTAGRGIGTLATAAACSIGFDQLGASIIVLEVLSANGRAAHVYEKVGFNRVDTFTDENGNEIVRMELTKTDFEGKWAHVNSSSEA